MFQTILRKGGAFFLALLLVLSYSLTAINPLTVSANTASVNEANSFKTTLVDRTTKSDRLTFDIWAKDANGDKISINDINITNNSKAVAVNWDDNEKTSYTLNLSLGENKINITVNGDEVISNDYTIIKLDAEDGENIGDYVFSLDAFTVGLGYIVEPTRMPIYKGQNAAQILDNQLSNQGFTYSNTGSLESGFYLSSISKKQGSIYDAGVNIPKEIEDLAYDIDPSEHEESLGEFDFNYMSGWMYKLNNVFPNVGFSDSYLQEDDVMSVQFTVGYGAELGGGWSGDSFPSVNRDEITMQLAYINSAGKWKELFLANNKVQEAYDNQMELMATFGIEQETINAAEQQMNEAIGEVINPLLASLPETITSENWKEIANTVEAVENTTKKQQRTFTNIEKYYDLKEKYDFFKTAEQLAVDFAKLPEVSEITLKNDLKNILKLKEKYMGLEENYQNLIENRELFLQVLAKINELLNEKIKEIEVKIDVLPTVENLQLADEEQITAIDLLIVELDEASKLIISNTDKLTAIKTQMVILKNNKKVADVIALINELKEAQLVVLEDKAKIKEVKAAYNALSTTLKKDVTNISKLTAAEAKITWFEAINTVVNNITKLPTVEAVNFSNEATIKNIRTSYDKLDEVQKANVTNINELKILEDKLLEYAPIKVVETQLNTLPSEYNTKLTDQEKINTARAAYEKLSESFKLKVQTSSYNKLVKAETKLQTLIDTANIAEITKLINELPKVENANLTSLEAVKRIRNQYDLLTAVNKAKVLNYEAFQLVEIKVLDLDAGLQTVVSLILDLPTVEKTAIYHENVINEAIEAKSELNESQLEFLSPALEEKLLQVKQTFDELKSETEIKEVNSLINALPKLENLTLEDEKKLINTQKQMEELSSEQLARITNKDVLDVLLAGIANLKMYDFNAKINEVNNLISALPELENIDISDEAKLAQITKEYSHLSEKQQEKVIGYEQITKMQVKIDDLMKGSIDVFEEIEKLPKVEKLKGADRPAIEKAREAFTLLTAGQQAQVKNIAQLDQIEKALAEEESNAVLKVVLGILTLPEIEKATLENNLAINLLANQYNELSKKQKELITNVSKLDGLIKKMEELQKNNNLVAQKVVEQIIALPSVITLNKKEKIEKVRLAYDELKIEQQGMVTNYTDLVKAETKLATLVENELKAANKVDAFIKALPTVSKLTNSDEPAINSVRKAYNGLTSSQKSLVKNLKVLEAAESQVKKLQNIEVITSKNAKMTVSTVKNTTTSITGTASKLTSVYVYKGNKLLASSKVNSSGKYTVKIAKQTKNAKLKIVQKNANKIIVKTMTITVKAATVLAPKSIKSTTKKVTGTSTGAKKVIIYKGKTKLATVSVNSKGKFSATIKTQKKGTKLTVVALDSVGNQSKKVKVTIK
ncbi:MAG: hypothetical protein KBT36_05405 [Kurthia sp.]|nr:hypothetical protein [Candidatus Kurthia equi]